ncbi:unnamed protein product [Rhodiola kirilowii]
MIRSVGGISCMTLSDNDAIQQQQPPKTRIHSLPKTLVLSSGAGSPVSEDPTGMPERTKLITAYGSPLHIPPDWLHTISLLSRDINDDIWPQSKLIVSGSMNRLKTRVLNFMQP